MASPKVFQATDALLRRARRYRKSVLRDLEILSESCDGEALHTLRKRFKRLRYFAETVSLIKGGEGARLVSQCKAIQSMLGEHQDAIVAYDLLESMARELAEIPEISHRTHLALGQIMAIERTRVAEARMAFFARMRSGIKLARIPKLGT